MMSPLRTLIPVLALCVLAACDRGDQAAVKASAEGEILEGSVSDAMLPLGSVRSQPPLAPRSEAGGQSGSTSRERQSGRDGDETPAEGPADGTEAPAAPPAAADTPTPAAE